MAASIKDVAATAGVSLGTVSNVLNRPEQVRAGTRAKVEAAIDALGYVRNDSARQLRAGVSRSLVYVCIDAANPFFTDVARGIDEAARAERLVLFLCDSQLDPQREQDYIEQVIEQRVRGICLTPVDHDTARLRRAAKRGVPIVLVDRVPEDELHDWCSVGVDDVLGGRLAVEHLADGGHRDIAFVGPTDTVPQSVDRWLGARKAAEDHAQSVDLVPVATSAMTFAEGRTAGDRVLGLPRRTRPTAVFCANDLLALGFLQSMTEHGVRVPDDMSIVGYDDIEFAQAAAIPLSSVRQPRAAMGRAAGELMLAESIEGSEHRHRTVRFEPELVVRQSSRPGHGSLARG